MFGDVMLSVGYIIVALIGFVAGYGLGCLRKITPAAIANPYDVCASAGAVGGRIVGGAAFGPIGSPPSDASWKRAGFGPGGTPPIVDTRPKWLNR